MAWHQVFTSDDKEIVKSYDKLQSQVAKLTGELAKMQHQAQEGSKSQSGGLADSLAFVGKLTAGYITLQGAVRLFNAEMENKLQIEQKSATATLGIAAAQEDFLVNLGAVSRKEQEIAMKRIEGIATARGAPRATAYSIGSEVVSARGAVSNIGAFNAEDLALRIYANNQESARAVAGGILDVANMTGITGDADQIKNLGFLQSIGTAARVPSMASIAENLVPGMKGVLGTGGTPEEAGELTAAMSTLMGDNTGRRSKTAAIQLAAQLKAFLPETDTFEWQKGKKKLLKQGTGLTGPLERLAHLQEHPELAEEFAAGLTGEVDALEPMRQLTRKGSLANQVLAEARKQIVSPERGGKIGAEYLANIGSVGVQPFAALERGLKSTTETLQVEDQNASIRGIAGPNVEEILQASGEGTIDRFIGRQMRNMGFIDDRSRLQHRLQTLRNPGAGDESYTPMAPDDSTRRQIELLEEAVKKYDETNATLKRIEQKKPPVQPNVHAEK